LRNGDLSGLVPDVAAAILAAAQSQEVVALAQSLGLDPIIVVVALLARSMTSHRSAQRIARAILGSASTGDVARAQAELGL
jgi:hypothetical protein